MVSACHAPSWRGFWGFPLLQILLNRVDIEKVFEYHEPFHVFFKITTQSKCNWACVTLKWFQGFVNCCDVITETIAASKFQGTQLAFKWFKIFMHCSHVFIQAAFMSKSWQSKGTFKLLNVFMNCFFKNTEVIIAPNFDGQNWHTKGFSFSWTLPIRELSWYICLNFKGHKW